MAHRTLKPGDRNYANLAARLNRFPQGAPPSERLFQILKMLLSEREAGLVAQLPIRPFTARRASELWKISEVEARKVLDYERASAGVNTAKAIGVGVCYCRHKMKQLLRVLLRGPDCGPPLRLHETGPHDELPTGAECGSLQRLREMRGGLPS